MTDRVKYKEHADLEREMKKFLAKGGQIKQVENTHTVKKAEFNPKSSVKPIETISVTQLSRLKSWCGVKKMRAHKLQTASAERLGFHSKNWLRNILLGKNKCTPHIFSVLCEEMQKIEAWENRK